MKVLGLICLLVGIQTSGWAQGATFPIEDARWELQFIWNACIGGSNLNVYCTEYLDGDTIIEEKTYTKVMILKQCMHTTEGTNCEESFSFPEDGVRAIGGIYEENGKVVFKRFNIADTFFGRYDGEVINIPVDGEIVIYDLNWVVGDSLYYPLEGGDSLLYDVIGMNIIDGKKRYGLQPRDFPTYRVFSTIEGMGGERGFFSMYYDITYFPVKLCYYNDDELLYGEMCENTCQLVSTTGPVDELLSIYPNPAYEEIFIESEPSEGPYMLRIFNFTGRLVYENKTFPGNAFISTNRFELKGLQHVVLTNREGRSWFGNVFVH